MKLSDFHAIFFRPKPNNPFTYPQPQLLDFPQGHPMTEHIKKRLLSEPEAGIFDTERALAPTWLPGSELDIPCWLGGQ